jgi:hypothetical protein
VGFKVALMYTELLDRLMHYLRESMEDTPRGEQHKQLLNDMLFGGKIVSSVDYDHAQSAVRMATRLCRHGDTYTARTAMYHCAVTMGLIR